MVGDMDMNTENSKDWFQHFDAFDVKNNDMIVKIYPKKREKEPH